MALQLNLAQKILLCFGRTWIYTRNVYKKKECEITEKEAKLREKPQQFKLHVVIMWGLRLTRAT